MFTSEADVWYEDTELNLLAQNFTIPGFSPLFPDAHCTAAGDICQLTTGEGGISHDVHHQKTSQLTILRDQRSRKLMALVLSLQFNLTSTYFMVAGISGGNTHYVTTGSVTFSRFAVQIDLQHLLDARQIPANASSSYYPQNAYGPDSRDPSDYPGEIYGTEAFELNVNLRDRFYQVASLATLIDTQDAATYRATYGYAPADQSPSVVKCDSATSNDYVSGSIIGDSLTNYTLLLTNGTGVYCGTQQEDNATLESLLRGALAGKIDFNRIAIMRTISDFDRAPPTETEVYHLIYADQQGFTPSIDNIYQCGIEIVKGIRMYWDSTYEKGVMPGNYIGDLFNSLDYPIAADIGTPIDYIN